MPLRQHIARHLMRWSLRLTDPPLTLEGMLMSTIKERLSALEGRCTALEARAGEHDDTITNAATKDDVAAVAQRVGAIEADIGSDPEPDAPDETQGDGGQPAPDATQG